MRIVATFIILLFATSQIEALPVGNPIEASLMTEGIFFHQCNFWSVRGGFYGDYVFNRHMKNSSGVEGEIRKAQITTNAAYFALNFCHRVDIYAIAGSSKFKWQAIDSVWGGVEPFDLTTLETVSGLSYGAGLRATLFRWKRLGVGAQGFYFRTRPEVNWARDNGAAPRYADGHKLKYFEWQFALGIAYQMFSFCTCEQFVPYAALQLSRARFSTGNLQLPVAEIETYFDEKNVRPLGYAVGVTYVLSCRSALTLEGRFAGEKALHFNAQFRF